jgi:hypothetical protein
VIPREARVLEQAKATPANSAGRHEMQVQPEPAQPHTNQPRLTADQDLDRPVGQPQRQQPVPELVNENSCWSHHDQQDISQHARCIGARRQSHEISSLTKRII